MNAHQPPLSCASLLVFLLLVLAGAGCMVPASGAPGDIDKSVDDDRAAVASDGLHLGDCWVEPGETTGDGFFQRDTVVCAIDPAAEDAFGANIFVGSYRTPGGGYGQSGVVDGPEMRLSYSAYHEFEPYPLTVDASLRIATDYADDSAVVHSYYFEIELDGPNATAELVVPASIWVVTLSGEGLVDAHAGSVQFPLEQTFGDLEINRYGTGRLSASKNRNGELAFMVPIGVTAIEATYTPYDGEPIPFVIEGSTDLVATDHGAEVR